MNDEPDFEELDARDREEEQWREARRLMALYDFEHWHKTGELRRLPVNLPVPEILDNNNKTYD